MAEDPALAGILRKIRAVREGGGASLLRIAVLMWYVSQDDDGDDKTETKASSSSAAKAAAAAAMDIDEEEIRARNQRVRVLSFCSFFSVFGGRETCAVLVVCQDTLNPPPPLLLLSF